MPGIDEKQGLTLNERDYPDLSDASEGTEGKGNFSFRIVSSGDGEVRIEFTNLIFDVGNAADKKLKSMVGGDTSPSKQDDEDTDDI